ncbi:hypothetical protein STRAU_7707 [Streptomyces aurantiacus JA 4570]|uniref:Uncharacterized protein n=1 Tax=Streptomyces aurantiacus JA 4570 TaxID=1286094 RepID=S3ZLS9_9ACTN|nr:hypothetical protein [Streptomyces aurantiacus]EPH39220.1 hypothetical protein STRAU_7707 [Streptomyces aurantiacus JA 4570]
MTVASAVGPPVTAVVTATPEARGVVRVRVAVRGPGATEFVDEHVRVAVPVASAWARLGDVLHAESAAPWHAARLGARHPGALVVAAHHGHVCRLRVGPSGTPLVLRTARLLRGARPEVPWPVWASLAHTFLAAGCRYGGWPRCGWGPGRGRWPPRGRVPAAWPGGSSLARR